MKYKGFHGTAAHNEPLILQGNFTVSAKLDEWLGTGAYFFIDGISNPCIDARNWAKMQAYDNKTKKTLTISTQLSMLKLMLVLCCKWIRKKG